ncbi:MAG: trigger factor [Bacteroidales bacterium]|nr:trigger factor [Bacteroidales bacterium]
MNVDKQVVDSVNAVVKIQLLKADYQEKVENTLKTYRKKANVPGFRPGNVPVGLIKKMYGKAVLADEVQNAISQALYDYIKENKLSILGEPLPSETQAEIDFDNQEDFEFSFDIALAPELNFTLNKKDSVPYYNIQITDEMVNEQVKNMAARNGSYIKVEKSEEKDILKGMLTEVQPDGTGITVEDAVLMPAYFKDEEEKTKMIGLGVGDTVVFNPAKAYDNTESEIASLLHIAKEVAKDITSDFSFEVKEITRYKDGDLNQDLFDQLFGKDTVKTEEEFRIKVKESLESQFAPESDYRLMVDAEKALVKKLSDIQFPVDFLKRWMLSTDKKRNAEEIETEMPKMIEDLKWHLMKEKIVKDNSLTVSEEDLMETAKKVTRAQFAQYGMMSVPDDLLANYAAEMLKKEETKRNILDQAMSTIVAAYLKGVIKLNEKSISVEDFNKLYA